VSRLGCRLAALAALAVGVLLPAAADAARPATVDGTYLVASNIAVVTGAVALQQTATPEEGDCERVTGVVETTGGKQLPISGFYCPATGRLVATVGKVASQYWTAQASANDPLRFTGRATVLAGPAGQLAEVPLVITLP
jgi:hypothetical protein